MHMQIFCYGYLLRYSVSRLFSYFTIAWPCIVTNSLWIKPTDALNSNFIGITTLHVSGSLPVHHQEFLAIHRLWYILCSCGDRLLPGVGWHVSAILLLVANGSWQLHEMYQSRCMAKNSWWWTGRLPETCRVVIPMKLEFSASAGFIHKEFILIIYSCTGRFDIGKLLHWLNYMKQYIIISEL